MSEDRCGFGGGFGFDWCWIIIIAIILICCCGNGFGGIGYSCNKPCQNAVKHPGVNSQGVLLTKKPTRFEMAFIVSTTVDWFGGATQI